MIRNLLRAAYSEDEPFPNDRDAFEIAFEDIAHFRIEPQVYHLLKRRGMLDGLTAPLRERLKAKADEALALNVYIRYETGKIVEALDAAGIAVMPIKGVRFAEQVFGHPGARATTDIDLLLRKETIDRAADIVRTLGFTHEEPYIRSHFHVAFSKAVPGLRHSLTVELQWGLLMEGTSRFAPEALWREAVPLRPYRHAKELSDDHLFYLICLHGWKHGLDSMKYVLDIVQLVHARGERIDYDRLLRDAKAHRTFNRLASTLSIVYRLFPDLERRKPLPLAKRTGGWWSYEAIRGRKASLIARYARFLRYQLLDFDTPRHGLTAAIQYLESTRNKPARR